VAYNIEEAKIIVVKKIGNICVGIVAVLAVLLCVYFFGGNKLCGERTAKSGVSADYQRIKEQLGRQDQTIQELRRQQQVDRGTIAELRADKQQLAETNRRLGELYQQQGDILQSVASGDQLDKERLDKLEKGIRELPKAK
jgi:hypothetical protein